MAGLDDVFAQYPDEGPYKFSNMTDLPPFEPELNALPPMIERFGHSGATILISRTMGTVHGG